VLDLTGESFLFTLSFRQKHGPSSQRIPQGMRHNSPCVRNVVFELQGFPLLLEMMPSCVGRAQRAPFYRVSALPSFEAKALPAA